MLMVGQTTKTLEERFKRHARNKKSLIGRTIRTHGADNFVSVILKECDSQKELDRWEKHFIKSYDSMFPNGYNFTEGGDGVVGYSPTAEVLAKIVASHTGKKHTPEIIVKMAAANRSGSFYKNLLREIINHQTSYNRLEKILGLSSGSLSRKMRGKVKFTEKDIAKLVEIFGLSAEYLMTRDD